jgi:heat-inducible transcriptional repressor
MLQEVIPLFKKALLESDKEVVYAEGMDKIFNFPEFADIDKAKRLIEALNKQNVLANLLSDDTSSDMNIRIGEENQVEAFKDCSLITATYKINGRPIGTVGVVGPTRMNYDYVVSVLDFLREELNAHISRLLNE